MQRDALCTIHGMETRVREKRDGRIVETWRKLQAIGYFQFMSTDRSGDGERAGT